MAVPVIFTMDYTDEELQMFERCFELAAEGYRMSSDIETQLRRTFWWMSASRAYLVVRAWIRNREKIGEILAKRSVQTTSEENEREYKHQDEQHGEACPTSS